jgi:hypothetical protein
MHFYRSSHAFSPLRSVPSPLSLLLSPSRALVTSALPLSIALWVYLLLYYVERQPCYPIWHRFSPILLSPLRCVPSPLSLLLSPSRALVTSALPLSIALWVYLLLYYVERQPCYPIWHRFSPILLSPLRCFCLLFSYLRSSSKVQQRSIRFNCHSLVSHLEH